MKNAVSLFTAVLVVAILGACARKEPAAGAEAAPPERAAGATAEKTYELRGRIVSRDAAKRTATVAHDRIEGLWEPMTMGFEVPEVDVAALPPDGSRIRATLHVEGERYWLTDVRPE